MSLDFFFDCYILRVVEGFKSLGILLFLFLFDSYCFFEFEPFNKIFWDMLIRFPGVVSGVPSDPLDSVETFVINNFFGYDSFYCVL